ncbi:MAG: hypothetical protein ACLP2J_14190 [Acidimicrobiales bacterium]
MPLGPVPDRLDTGPTAGHAGLPQQLKRAHAPSRRDEVGPADTMEPLVDDRRRAELAGEAAPSAPDVVAPLNVETSQPSPPPFEPPPFEPPPFAPPPFAPPIEPEPWEPEPEPEPIQPEPEPIQPEPWEPIQPEPFVPEPWATPAAVVEPQIKASGAAPEAELSVYTEVAHDDAEFEEFDDDDGRFASLHSLVFREVETPETDAGDSEDTGEHMFASLHSIAAASSPQESSEPAFADGSDEPTPDVPAAPVVELGRADAGASPGPADPGTVDTADRAPVPEPVPTGQAEEPLGAVATDIAPAPESSVAPPAPPMPVTEPAEEAAAHDEPAPEPVAAARQEPPPKPSREHPEHNGDSGHEPAHRTSNIPASIAAKNAELFKGNREFPDLLNMALKGSSLADQVEVKYDATSTRRTDLAAASKGDAPADDEKGGKRWRRKGK